MLIPHKRIHKRIELLLLVPISVGVFLLCIPHVPLWTAGSAAVVVLVAAAWAGL